MIHLAAAYPSPKHPYRACALHFMLISLNEPAVVFTPRVDMGDAPSEQRGMIKIYRYSYPLWRSRPKAVRTIPHDLAFCGATLVAAMRAARLAKKKNTCLYAHWVVPHGVAAAFAARIFSVPLILHVHGSDFSMFGHMGWLWRFALKKAEAVFAAGSVLADAVASRFGVEVEDAGTALPPGGPLEKNEAKRLLAIPPDKIAVLYAGDILAGKGGLVAAEAARWVRAARSDFEFLFIGEGRLRGGGGIRICGAVEPDRSWCYFSAADLFLLPSKGEGVSAALVQALMCGAVPVVTPVGEAVRLVRHGETGFFVDGGTCGVVRLLRRLQKERISKMAAAIRGERIWDKVFAAAERWQKNLKKIAPTGVEPAPRA